MHSNAIHIELATAVDIPALSRLLTRAIEMAGKHECRRINLLTDQDNAAAQRFYARHGFVTSSMTTLRRLKN